MKAKTLLNKSGEMQNLKTQVNIIKLKEINLSNKISNY